MPGDATKPGGEVLERQHRESQTPKMFHVVLLNDDYTTMEFVVSILEGVFQKNPAEAYRLMMEVHTQGKSVCGTYTYEIAETKAVQVRDLAAQEGFPLQVGIEEA